ncbi:MAG: menaquinone biosynthesis decarboxylase, partial [Bacteroidota bacterium]
SPPDFDFIKRLFPEIKDINSSLVGKAISMVFISIDKGRMGHVKELGRQLCSLEEFRHIKLLIFLEHTVDISDIGDAIWRFSNNVDPRRDAMIIEPSALDECSHLIMDGTRKTKELDGFQRDWPNILASDETTIQAIDQKWDALGLGPFIPSPSRKYADQLYGKKAVAE